MGWNRRRSYALAGLAAVAGLLLAVIPAFGDSHPDAVRLHLGTDGQYFEYEDTRQHLTSTRCEINELNGPVMTLEANRKVGVNAFGIGVKSGGAQGTPCGRVDNTEALSLSVPGAGELAGRFFDGVRFDLELKGNARVIATLYNGTDQTGVFELGSGSSIEQGDEPAEQDGDDVFEALSTDDDPNVACGSQSDSGPDAGSRDNCLWTITTEFEFNRIVLTAEVGEFSLEGSADYGDDPAFDSLFFIANAAPAAVDDTASTNEDTSISTPTDFDVLANDSDADGHTLTVASIDTTGTTGTVTLDGSGDITYNPNGQFEDLNVGQSNTDSFGYTVSDENGGADTATVTVTVTGVNDPPVLTASSVTTDEDTPVDIALDFTDPDDSVFTTNCSSDDGTWADDTTNRDGSGTFTPNADFNGPASLNCTVTDEHGAPSNQATVTVTVNAVNDAPTANDDEGFIDAATEASVNIDVLANDTDIDDGDTLSVASFDTTTAEGGTVAKESDGTLTYTPPSSDFIGSDTFNYTVEDSGALQDTATVTVSEVLTCGESLDVPPNEWGVSGTYTRLDSDTCDDDKPYTVDVIGLGETGDSPAVLFQPRPKEGDPVEDCSIEADKADCDDEFRAELTFEPRLKDNAPDTGTLQYDPVAQDDPNNVSFRDMPWCVFDPFADGVEDRRAALPEGESWCIVEVSTVIVDTAKTATEWITYGIGDPWKIAT